MKMHIVAGARPNLLKVAPLLRAAREKYFGEIDCLFIHTGQHYDDSLSKVFIEDLEIPQPDVNFGVGSLPQAHQVGVIMEKYERLCAATMPDVLVVVGDTNSSLGCALAAAKLPCKIAHVEAGLRRHDMTIPEEVNRVLIDKVSDYHFPPHERAATNLHSDGYIYNSIHRVGDVMIDTLIYALRKLKQGGGSITSNAVRPYVLCTLHRPVNVDNKENLQQILEALDIINQSHAAVVLPLHPRTHKRMLEFDLDHYMETLRPIGPVGYLDFVALMKSASLIITDSGGIQPEAVFLGVPCVTLLDATVHPFSEACGINQTVPCDTDSIYKEAVHALRGDRAIRPYNDEWWDGRAAERILHILVRDHAGTHNSTTHG